VNQTAQLIQPPSTVRRNLAIVFVDIVNSTSLMAELGDFGWPMALSKFQERAKKLANKHHGQLIKSLGDGFLAIFESISDVLPFSISLTRKGFPHRTALSGQTLTFRFSLHLGMVEVMQTSYGEDVFGQAVAVAARLNSLAGPSQLVISRVALEHLPHQQRALATPAEQVRLKGLDLEFSRINLANA
jgi:class 3 adenylate cyclase